MFYLKIGARKYTIKSVSDQEFTDFLQNLGVDHLQIENAKSFIDYDSQIIMIRDKLQDDHKQELLLHELLHACFEDSGVEQSVDIERFIRIMSPRLNQILNENYHLQFISSKNDQLKS